MADLLTIAQDIADRLSLIVGEAWTAEIPPHRIDDMRLLHTATDHAEMTIERMHTGNRLVLSGSFWIDNISLYEHRPDRDARHTITVAADRPATQIAREIARRLLPAYRADLAEARRRKAVFDDARAYEEATAAELASIIHGGIYAHQERKNTFHNGSTGPHLKAYVSHGYGVTFERISNVSVDAARRILEILADVQLVRPA
jgi:hypothetical protein